jgi:hypothetical protein
VATSRKYRWPVDRDTQLDHPGGRAGPSYAPSAPPPSVGLAISLVAALRTRVECGLFEAAPPSYSTSQYPLLESRTVTTATTATAAASWTTARVLLLPRAAELQGLGSALLATAVRHRLSRPRPRTRGQRERGKAGRHCAGPAERSHYEVTYGHTRSA